MFWNLLLDFFASIDRYFVEVRRVLTVCEAMGELGHPEEVGIATDVIVTSDGAAEAAAAAVGVANIADDELHCSQFIEEYMEEYMEDDMDMYMEDMAGFAIMDEGIGGAATKEVTLAVGLPP